MDIFAHIFTPIIMLMSGFVGAPQQDVVNSVELGLIEEVSPKGAEGGFAMPASGCAYVTVPDFHDNSNANCTDYPVIDLDPRVIRSGEDVEVSWEVGEREDCVLTYLDQTVSAANDGSVSDIVLTAETIFTITCTGATASVVGRVLPKIQET